MSYPIVKGLGLILLIAAGCSGQTVVNAVGTSSSLQNVIAPQMLASIGGPQFSSPIPNFLFESLAPQTLKSVFIRPAGSSTLLPTNILPSIGGTTFIVPAGTPLGTAEILWQGTDGIYRGVNVTVARSNFELAQTGPLGSNLTTPARPGQTLTLSGSGLGFGTTVTASIGGLPANVIYAGHDGLRPGYDQIQLQVPLGVADSCYAPFVLTVGGAPIATSLSITSDGAPCRHPFDLSLNDMKTLDAGGSLLVANVSLQTELLATLATAVSRQDGGTINIEPWTAWQFTQLFRPMLTPSICAIASPVTAGFRNGDFSSLVGNPFMPPDLAPPALKNQTSTVTFTGSNGFFSAVLPASQDGTLASPPATAFPPGQWTWNSAASADFPAAAFNFSLPDPLLLAAPVPLTLHRSQDQTIAWNGAKFDAAARITVSLNARNSGAGCSASASAGSVTIPASLLSQFPASSIGTVFARIAPAGPSLPHRVLKTKTGATMLVLINYFTADTRPVDFQ